MGFNTDLLHSGVVMEEKGATLPPIYQSSAFEQATASDLAKIFENKKAGYCYTRVGNQKNGGTLMTIQQLKYVVALSNSISMREASGKLYITQAALSATVRDLEEELGLRIFDRSNKGITVTEEGNEFVSYAKQAVSQYELVEQKYLGRSEDKVFYTISMQHYVFALHAFINAIQQRDASRYSYLIKETKTHEVLTNVRDYKSEIGILAVSSGNNKILTKLLREYGLEFHPLMVCDTYVYLGNNHPLSASSELSLEDLREYPCITFDQSNETEFYLSEEALSNYSFDRLIRTNDRATSCELVTMLNGFAIGTGNMTESFALKDTFVSVKLKEEDPLTIGYILKKNHILSDFGKLYIEELEKFRNARSETEHG